MRPSRTCRECGKEFRAFKNYVVCLVCRTADGINTSAHCQKEWARVKEKVMDVVVLPGGRMFLDDAVRKALVQVEALEQRFQQLEARLANLEAPRDKESLAAQLKSQAAQLDARQNAQYQTQDVNMCNTIHPPLRDDAQQQAQGTKGDGGPYAPLRSDTKPLIDLAAFARRLLNPDDLGHAVTKEVRDSARRALGMPEVREYDL